MPRQTFRKLEFSQFPKSKVYVSERFQWQNNMIVGFGNVQKSQGKEARSMKLFKYSSFNYVYTNIVNRTFTFVSPEKWEDPFEKLAFNLKRSNNKVSGKKGGECHEVDGQTMTGSVCVSSNCVHGEEWAWKSYRKNIPIVRLTYDINKLIEMFAQLSNNDDASFYLSVIDYSLERKELAKYLNSGEVNSVEDYVNKMSLKRMAFDTEREVRIFVFDDSKTAQSKTNGAVRNFKVSDFDFVSYVTLPPYMIENDVNAQCENISKVLNKGMEDFFKENGFGNKINQCQLYNL